MPAGSLSAWMEKRIGPLLSPSVGRWLLRLSDHAPLPAEATILLWKLALDHDDYGRAIAFGRRLVLLRPDRAQGYLMEAQAVRRQRRLAEAEDLTRAVSSRFPGEATAMAELARVLADRGEREAALEQWRLALAANPDQEEIHFGTAVALRELLRFDEADAFLRTALERFPESLILRESLAFTVGLAGNRDEALRLWQAQMQKYPDRPDSYMGLGTALSMLGQFDEAETVLTRGMKRFPAISRMAIDHARLAMGRGDWDEAKRRWTTLSQQWPDNPVVRDGLGQTAMGRNIASINVAVDDENASSAATRVGDQMYELVTAFESLGDNCELGFVQRHFGAEPLGLFRWAGISPIKLAEAMESDLAGIGEEEFTEIYVNPGNREYVMRDTRYGMETHTFVLVEAAPPDLGVRMRRRLAFLRDKLLADLREGRKILVVNTAAPLSKEELRRIRGALGRQGPVRLMNVAAMPEEPVGRVTQVDSSIWRGALPRPGFDGKVWDIDFAAWEKLLRNALASISRAAV